MPDSGIEKISTAHRSWEHALMAQIGLPQGARAISLALSGPGGFWRLLSPQGQPAKAAECLFRLSQRLIKDSPPSKPEADSALTEKQSGFSTTGRSFLWEGRKAALCAVAQEEELDSETIAPYWEKAIFTLAVEKKLPVLAPASRELHRVSRLAEVGLQYGCLAHEINGPLANLRAQLELQLMEPEKADLLGERLQKAIHQVSRIEALLASLRRSLDGVSPPEPNIVSMAEILEECGAILKPRVVREGVTLSFDIAENFSVSCRRGEIAQAIVNLLNNSFDAVDGQRSKEVSVKARSGGGVITILVKDSGPGISAAVESSLMEPYVSSKGEKGTGLGLFLSRNLVEGHSGALLPVREEQGQGFAIFLPA